ncbi:hypothetical protein ABPG74_008247 [Tetrahymena malaccensis]
MRHLLTEVNVTIPEGVTVTAKQRVVEVKGPLGTIKRAFRYASVDIQKPTKDNVKLQIWQASRKERAVLQSIGSQIKNMIRGVTEGYKFKMKLAFAHFPIQESVAKDGSSIEIKHFLGEKRVRRIQALPGVKITRKDEEKNTLTLQGIDLNNVSQTCALIHQSCLVKDKDIRQFLDGIYVSDKRLALNE